VLKDFDALFIGWALTLEQSHLRETRYKMKGPLYCYCGCVLLAILILSNAYKGDNIRTLTKTFEIVPLTYIDQVIKSGYKTHSLEFCSESFPELNIDDNNVICVDDFHSDANDINNPYADQQYKLCKPMAQAILKIALSYDMQLHIESCWDGVRIQFG